MYREYKGNLFTADVQTLVNTVNCVGVMGKGVALEFRRRFPEMYAEYRIICAERKLRPGQLLPYRRDKPWILNFAVKDDWKQPSKLAWVEDCLHRFSNNYKRLGITSVAFPWIAAMNGRIPWPEVHALMQSYLEPLADIRIEIVEFDPNASDPIFSRIVEYANPSQLSAESFAERVGITRKAATRLYDGLLTKHVTNLSELTAYPGLGDKTIDRLYLFFRHELEPMSTIASNLSESRQAKLWE